MKVRMRFSYSLEKESCSFAIGVAVQLVLTERTRPSREHAEWFHLAMSHERNDRSIWHGCVELAESTGKCDPMRMEVEKDRSYRWCGRRALFIGSWRHEHGDRPMAMLKCGGEKNGEQIQFVRFNAVSLEPFDGGHVDILTDGRCLDGVTLSEMRINCQLTCVQRSFR